MTPPINNLITKDPQHFLTGTAAFPEGNAKYIDLVFSIVSKTVNEDRSSESEQRKALSLYLSVLHNCTGQVDSYLPTINDVVLAKLGQQVNAENAATRHSIFQVLGSALYYNPQLEVAELEKRGCTHQVMTQWIKDVDSMEKWLTKKMTVLGLLSVLRLPASSLPQSVVSLIPNIISTAVTLTVKMKEELEAGHKDDDDGAIEAEADDDDDWGGYDEDEDVTNADDEAYMNALNKVRALSLFSRYCAADTVLHLFSRLISHANSF